MDLSSYSKNLRIFTNVLIHQCHIIIRRSEIGAICTKSYFSDFQEFPPNTSVVSNINPRCYTLVQHWNKKYPNGDDSQEGLFRRFSVFSRNIPLDWISHPCCYTVVLYSNKTSSNADDS